MCHLCLCVYNDATLGFCVRRGAGLLVTRGLDCWAPFLLVGCPLFPPHSGAAVRGQAGSWKGLQGA